MPETASVRGPLQLTTHHAVDVLYTHEDPLVFSKKLADHIGALKYFICKYNLTRDTALHGPHYR